MNQKMQEIITHLKNLKKVIDNSYQFHEDAEYKAYLKGISEGYDVAIKTINNME